ncbi:5'-nucleotidase domain-containing protein 1-like [Crassostrea virginica]
MRKMIKILKNYFRFGSCKSFSARSISHRVRRSRHSVAGAMTTADDGKFCLADYDAIGFDMDHTLAKYKLVNLLNLIYDSFCESLVKNGYNSKIQDNLSTHKDFVCKGLFLDSKKGNILKLSHDGKILRCSHGTRMMGREEMVSVYGKDLHWEHFQEAVGHVKLHGKGMMYRFFETYFDIPAIICCAHIVDVLDEENGGPCEEYNFWNDVLEAIGTLYFPPKIQEPEDTGNARWLLPFVRKDPGKYLQSCSNGVKDWLKELKGDNRTVFLMTSSNIDYAGMVLETVLGSDWKSYFHIVMTDARKPGFFIDKKKFKLIGKIDLYISGVNLSNQTLIIFNPHERSQIL